MSKDKHTVVLVYKKGGDFKMRDVLLLAYHIQKQYKGDDLEIVCLCDVHEEVTLKGLTLVPLQTSWIGWWSKMNLFSPAMEKYRPFLYLDLDTAVLSDVRHYFNKLYIDYFITLNDFYKAGKLATGAMFIPNNNPKVDFIWETWISDPVKNMRFNRGDQEFIRTITEADYFFQDIYDGVYSFKPKGGKLTTLPKDARIVCFHGKPRPVEAATRVKWVADYFREGFEYEE